MALARSMLALGLFLTVAGLALLVLPWPGIPLLVTGLMASVAGYIGMSAHRRQT